MSFNPTKCYTMHITRKNKTDEWSYTLKGVVLENVDTDTYLGINLSANLSWNTHVKKVAAKANRTLGFIKRNLKEASKQTKARAYQALV